MVQIAEDASFGRKGLEGLPAKKSAQPWPDVATRQPFNDRSAWSQPLQFFLGVDGRIGCRDYLLGRGAVMLALSGVLALGQIANVLTGAGMSGPLAAETLAVVSPAWVWSELALQVKRRHDLNQSWTWTLLGFIPVVGPVLVFVECGFKPGGGERNSFGAPPAGG